MTTPSSSESRRQFIRRLSGLGVAAATVPGFSFARRSTPPPQQGLGVALVGLGNYATHQLAPALQETEHCHLAGVVTGTPSKAESWRQKYDIPEDNIYDYDTFDRIADNPDIDIVYVVLPNALHAEYTIRAAQAGKHVLCEKPMATSVEDCEAMIEACNEAGRKLSIGYRLHFEPHNQEVMRLGQDEILGPVKFMETSFGFRIRNPDQWRLDKKMAGGGPLVDVGIYAIQAARYTTGEEPVAVTAQSTKTQPDFFTEVEETLFWQLEFPSGAVANSSTSYAGYVERLYGAAEDGWFRLHPAYSYGRIQGTTSQGPMDFPQVNQQALQMDAFAQCILEDRESRVPGEEGLQDVKIIEAIYEAADTGARVTIA